MKFPISVLFSPISSMMNRLIQRRLSVAAAFFSLALLSGCASIPERVSDDQAEVKEQAMEQVKAQLTRQADLWDQAIVRKDKAAIEANMAEDFRQIDGDGDLEDQASFVAGLMSPKLEIAPYKVEDFDIRLYGDVALLSGRTRMSGRYDGKPFSSHYRYIDIYLRRAGVWRIVSVQISKVRD